MKKGMLNRTLRPLPDFGSFELRKNGRALTAREKKLFGQRCEELQDGNCRIIYRGERKSGVGRRFGLDIEQSPEAFNDRLFLIGQKGRHFWREVSEQVAGNTRDIPLADASDEVFRRVFDMLAELLTVRRFSAGVQAAIDRFIEKEPACVHFFASRENKERLVQAVHSLPERKRIRIRDYYLTLLHHMGASEYYSVSFLLSATLSWEVARRFSADARRAGDEMIIMGWVPWGANTILHTFRFGGWGWPDLLDTVGLPSYHRSFFPRQQEITLKGGLLPHYILGYYYTDRGQPVFEVNPWLFEIVDVHWVKSGLPVDQRNFYQELSQTEYQRAFILLETNREFREL